MGKIVLGTVEITSGIADILINYSNLCEGNKAFCATFKEYNTYLQLGLLGSGLIRSQFLAIRKKAKESYKNHRATLVNKYGKNDSRIKELDNHFKLANSVDVSSVVKRLKGISTKYADDALEQIAKKADELKLNSKVTDDFIRVGELKDFNSSSLIEQMQNWVKIKKRGFPFSFNTLSEFKVFKDRLNKLLRDVNINIADVRIQGSSLRKVNPNDIDVAVFLKQSDYDDLVKSIRNRYAEINKRAQRVVRNSKSFEKGLLKGKISSFHFNKLSNGDTFKKALFERLGRDVDLSIVVEGKKFDISPYLKF